MSKGGAQEAVPKDWEYCVYLGFFLPMVQGTLGVRWGFLLDAQH
jgi:hypothetical protein